MTTSEPWTPYRVVKPVGVVKPEAIGTPSASVTADVTRTLKAEPKASPGAGESVTTVSLSLMTGLATEKGRFADQRFHMTMMEATQNDAMIALASSILAAIAWTTIYKQRNRALPRDPIPEHRALLEAIAASDIEGARAAMTELVRLALADTEISLLDDDAVQGSRS